MSDDEPFAQKATRMNRHGYPPSYYRDDPQPSITCPRCGLTSYDANDIREGYCGNCHDWTTATP